LHRPRHCRTFRPRSKKELKNLTLPANIVVRPRPLGQQDLMKQTLEGLGGSLILSVVLVFLLMVALYNSYRRR